MSLGIQLLLPLEVIQSIIQMFDPYDDDDLATLKSCSLACRALYRWTRRPLFTSVKLLVDPENVDVEVKENTRLLEIISRTPSTASYIEFLILDLTPMGRESSHPQRDTISPILRILSVLNLQHLCLQSPVIEGLDWRSFSSSFVSALAGLARSPMLTIIHIEYIKSIPLSFYSRFSALEQLYLYQTHRNGLQMGDSTLEGVPQLRLKHFESTDIEIDDLHRLFFAEDPIADVGYLRGLNVDNVDEELLVNFGEACGSTLNALEFGLDLLFEDDWPSPNVDLSLTSFKALTGLAVVIDRIHCDGSEEIAMQKLERLRPHLLKLSSLHRLTFIFHGFDPMKPFLEGIDSNLGSFPKLEQFHVAVGDQCSSAGRSESEIEESICDKIEDSCPVALERDILYISISFH